MFAADLSWTDQNDEKVGERRVRKAKEREGSIESASTKTSHDLKSPTSRNGSISASTDRGNGSSSAKRRPSYWSRSPFKSSTNTANKSKKNSIEERSEKPHAEEQSRRLSLPFRDSSLQLGWTITTKIPSTLPSGGSIDPIDLPQSPKGTSTSLNSHGSPGFPFFPLTQPSPRSNSLAGRVSVETSVQRTDEVVDALPAPRLPRKDSRRNLAAIRSIATESKGREKKASDPANDLSPTAGPVVPPKDDVQVSSEKTLPNFGDLPGSYKGLPSSSLGTTTTIWSDAKLGKPIRRPSGLRHRRTESSRSSQSQNPEVVSSRKDSSDGWSQGPVKETHKGSPSTYSSSSDDWPGNQPPSPLPLTHFQGFIRRMEQAGPRLVYDHLREEQQLPEDETSRAELKLERYLWVLTALHLKSISDKFLVSGAPILTNKKTGVRNVLELDGNIAEVFQLSALCPQASVFYLATRPIPQIQLPNQISCTYIPPSSLPSLPYPTASLDFVRAASLPSLLPSAQIPALLADCHRVLAPGGCLELRLLDPLPQRRTSGPMLRAWIEVRLLLNLELSFRCTRPSMLIPQWAQEAGFVLQQAPRSGVGREPGQERGARGRSGSEAVRLAQRMELPAANDDQGVVGAYVDEEVGAMVGRELWKDVWGEFVTERQGEERWWWENEGCLREAMERGTKWSVLTLLAVKPKGL
ncbi:MAG: hypothetical protein M1821_005934 [Bathelium mastoideum]|nr:MAG: hypothetical protein M1821_005934 [Bathelium mastoideum]